MFDLMSRCRTGGRRLKGLLPGVRVAHKTASIIWKGHSGDRRLRLCADVGLIELPAERGEIAIAAFVVDSPHAAYAQDRAIARVARTVYDYFATDA